MSSPYRPHVHEMSWHVLQHKSSYISRHYPLYVQFWCIFYNSLVICHYILPLKLWRNHFEIQFIISNNFSSHTRPIRLLCTSQKIENLKEILKNDKKWSFWTGFYGNSGTSGTHWVSILYPWKGWLRPVQTGCVQSFFCPRFEATTTSNFTKARQLQLRSGLFWLWSSQVAVFFQFMQPNMETLHPRD